MKGVVCVKHRLDSKQKPKTCDSRSVFFWILISETFTVRSGVKLKCILHVHPTFPELYFPTATLADDLSRITSAPHHRLTLNYSAAPSVATHFSLRLPSLKSFVVMRGKRGVVQNKVISDWIVSNQSENQKQWRILKPRFYPSVSWLDQKAPKCVRNSVKGQGGARIQTHCNRRNKPPWEWRRVWLEQRVWVARQELKRSKFHDPVMFLPLSPSLYDWQPKVKGHNKNKKNNI